MILNGTSNGEFDFSVWIQEIGHHEQLLASLKQLADEEDASAEKSITGCSGMSSEKKNEIDGLRKNLDHLE